MYKKVSTDMNFVEREKEVEKFWDDENIFQKSMDEKEGCPDYIFYDGPPTANGKPHIDSEIPHNERLYGSEKGRMGYAWSSGRAGS